MADIDGLLKLMSDRGSSDLHLKVGSPPAIRLNGKLVVLHDLPSLTADATKALALGMMDERQRQSFENHHELDFAYSLSGVGRFRVNIFRQRGQHRHHATPRLDRPCVDRRAGPSADRTEAC